MVEGGEFVVDCGETHMVFRAPDDEIVVRDIGQGWKIVNRLRKKFEDAHAIATRNPPQLFLFVGNEKFQLGFDDGVDPEELARRLNRWLKLAGESRAKADG